MNGLFQSLALLAESERLIDLTQGMNRRQSEVNLTQVVIVLVSIVGLIVLVFVIAKIIDSILGKQSHSPLGLFLLLCKVHGLKWSESWFLWNLARQQRLKQPAQLFLLPECFLPKATGPTTPLRAARIKAFSKRLFSGLPTDAKAKK